MGRVARRRRTMGRGMEDLLLREAGEISPRTFARHFAASEEFVLRFDIYKKLVKHSGCVNTVSFDADGDILVSGSDDRMVTLWNWNAGIPKLAFHSGHLSNLYQAKTVPYADDQSILTCGADGQVRHALIREGGQVETEKLGQHEGRVLRLAICPGSPHLFYTCAEDGIVQQFDLRQQTSAKLFTCHSFPNRCTRNPNIHLYAIAIDPRNPNCLVTGGSEEYARVYDIRKCKLDGATSHDHPADCFCPPHLLGDSKVGITGLAFSDQSELLVSYNDEHIYLFSKDMGLGLHPVTEFGSIHSNIASSTDTYQYAGSKSEPLVYKGHKNCETIKGVSFFGPSCEYVVSGSDCGRIFIWKKKNGELLRVMEGDKHVVNCIEPHPHATVLASCGIENDVKIWIPNATARAKLPVNLDENLIVPRQITAIIIDDAYENADYGADSDDNILDDDDSGMC